MVLARCAQVGTRAGLLPAPGQLPACCQANEPDHQCNSSLSLHHARNSGTSPLMLECLSDKQAHHRNACCRTRHAERPGQMARKCMTPPPPSCPCRPHLETRCGKLRTSRPLRLSSSAAVNSGRCGRMAAGPPSLTILPTVSSASACTCASHARAHQGSQMEVMRSVLFPSAQSSHKSCPAPSLLDLVQGTRVPDCPPAHPLQWHSDYTQVQSGRIWLCWRQTATGPCLEDAYSLASICCTAPQACCAASRGACLQVLTMKT